MEYPGGVLRRAMTQADLHPGLRGRAQQCDELFVVGKGPLANLDASDPCIVHLLHFGLDLGGVGAGRHVQANPWPIGRRRMANVAAVNGVTGLNLIHSDREVATTGPL